MRSQNRLLIIGCMLILLFGCQVKKNIRSDYVLNKNKIYLYHSFYLNPSGDTIIKDSFSLRALDKPWIGQLRRQEAVEYNYYTDEKGYLEYIDPEPFYRKKDSVYLTEEGDPKIVDKEITGAISIGDSKYFWIHPPRSNQFRMLTYSAYPSTGSKALKDTTIVYSGYLNRYGLGKFLFDYKVNPIETEGFKEPLFDSISKVWSIRATSKLQCREDVKCDTNLYNSTLDAIYSKEYGFIQLKYNFSNGVHICIRLNQIL